VSVKATNQQEQLELREFDKRSAATTEHSSSEESVGTQSKQYGVQKF